MRTSVVFSIVAGSLLSAISLGFAQAPVSQPQQPIAQQQPIVPPPGAQQPIAQPPTMRQLLGPPPVVQQQQAAPQQPIAQPASQAEIPPQLPPPPVYTDPAPPAAKPTPASFYASPRAFVLSVGWSYTPTNSLPVATQVSVVTPMGAVVDAGLTWKVRGFDGIRWPAWVGFMSGFLYYGGQTGVADTYGLAYGIYVKHALFPRQRTRLFFGYGLGASQVWIRGLEGRGTGHYTRLSMGVDIHLVRWLYSTVEFSYRFFNLPTFKFAETDSGGYDFHTLSLLAGFWFGR